MNNSDKAITILQNTDDGDKLTGSHLGLLEAAVNGNLTAKGQKMFDDLYQQVVAGVYRRPWFHGIEHLDKQQTGYVLWKGIPIEHFSYRDFEAEKKGAERLAKKCRYLEERGEEVTASSVLDVGWDNVLKKYVGEWALE